VHGVQTPPCPGFFLARCRVHMDSTTPKVSAVEVDGAACIQPISMQSRYGTETGFCISYHLEPFQECHGGLSCPRTFIPVRHQRSRWVVSKRSVPPKASLRIFSAPSSTPRAWSVRLLAVCILELPPGQEGVFVLEMKPFCCRACLCRSNVAFRTAEEQGGEGPLMAPSPSHAAVD
jgi:hypothetical protein